MTDEYLDATVTSATNYRGERPTPPMGAPETVGTLIGRYYLVDRIGAGGMAEVWLAEQREPVRRRVALKLIKAGLNSREVIARFESERRALALMDHPAIAKVLDADSTTDGAPYFVMEYVAGLPIVEYCDEHKLSTRERLELFIHVCEGVQHAHQKAIIHRDLKPSNILVVEVDGRASPKIIDFGIAKALAQKFTGETRFTHAGALVGTPNYMSPEQALSSVEDIDTRSDVYSLGIVMYELLVGALPLQLEELPFEEFLRRLREDDPPTPSTRIRMQDRAALAELARKRQTDAATLAKQLKGDLDWIILKALERDRRRRYATPLELAADIERYLRNAPVYAHPPGFAYRTSKYVRRHRVGVAVAAAALVLLVGFAVAQGIELRTVRQQRDRADFISKFMAGIFKVSNPSEARGNTITAREILDQASQQIGTSLNNDPVLQAQLMETMGQTYTGLGLYGRAQALTEQALAIRRSLFGERDRATLETESDLAQLILSQGHYVEAEKLVQATLETQRKVLGPDDPDTLASMDRLGYVYANEARHAEAESLFRQTLDAERRVLGPGDPRTLSTWNELAETLTPQGRYADADKIYEELIAEQRRSLGPDHPATLLSMSHAAENLSEEGRYPQAEKLYAETIAGQRRVLGPEHPQTLRAMTMLGATLMKEGRYAEADALQTQVIEIKRRVLGPTHASTLQSMEMEAMCLSREKRYADSEKMFRDVIDTAQKTSQPATVAEAWYNFATAEAARGRVDEAFADLNQAIQDGRISPSELSSDPGLKSLHDDPRFASVVATARETSAAITR
jgi:eukaryotic-like serine/threonine-protein kinase